VDRDRPEPGRGGDAGPARRLRRLPGQVPHRHAAVPVHVLRAELHDRDHLHQRLGPDGEHVDDGLPQLGAPEPRRARRRHRRLLGRPRGGEQPRRARLPVARCGEPPVDRAVEPHAEHRRRHARDLPGHLLRPGLPSDGDRGRDHRLPVQRGREQRLHRRLLHDRHREPREPDRDDLRVLQPVHGRRRHHGGGACDQVPGEARGPDRCPSGVGPQRFARGAAAAGGDRGRAGERARVRHRSGWTLRGDRRPRQLHSRRLVSGLRVRHPPGGAGLGRRVHRGRLPPT